MSISESVSVRLDSSITSFRQSSRLPLKFKLVGRESGHLAGPVARHRAESDIIL